MKYYIINRDENCKGVPFLLNAVLAENFDPKNPMPPMKGYSWTPSPGYAKKFPKELYLISKDRLYKFDYMPFWIGYVISSDFFELIAQHSNFEYTIVKLHTINWKGKVITDKKYFFLYIPYENWLNAIDFEKSKFILDDDLIKMKGLSAKKILNEKDFVSNIKTYDSIYINESKCDNNQIFKVNDNILHDLICSDSFLKKMMESNIYGINAIDTDLSYKYFSKFETNGIAE